MNRRARRRAARQQRAGRRTTTGEREPLPVAWRLLLAIAGCGLIAGSVALAVHGGTARAGRVIGALAIAGAVLLAIAWQGRRPAYK